MRKSCSEDAEFAFEAVKVTMRDYAIQTWGVWLEKESKEAAIEDTSKGKIEIIIFEGGKAGTLQIERLENEIFVHQIYLLPNFQNLGIGSSLLNYLKEMAKEFNLPLKLSVLQVNPAKQFYINRGFIVVSETSERVSMQYVP